MKPLRHYAAALIVMASGAAYAPAGAGSLITYVDTSIGTGANNADFTHGREPLGQCMPAVLVPYGMNFWTPQTESSEGHGVSPYYYNKTRMHGFRNSHYISGGSTQDYGSVSIMPLLDTLRCMPEDRASEFSHMDEVLRPDYYSVELFGGNIRAEMTGTSRTGIFRFTYRKAGTAYLVITPNSDEGQGQVSIDARRGEVTGCNPVHRMYLRTGQPAGFSGHFLVQVKNKVTGCGTYDGRTINAGRTSDGGRKNIGAYLSFKVDAGDEIIVKVASSFCDVEGARNNMRMENPGWSFNKVRSALTRVWEKHLGTLKAEGGTRQDLVKFYTSLYHASFCPNAMSDADGRYPSFAGGKTIERTHATYYDNFSLWDTFRALHPLITLLRPSLSGDMMESFVNKYEQSGWLPMFSAWNSFTQEMIGDHAASLIAEAYFKGVRNFDVGKAYEALVKMAFETPEDYSDYADGKGRRALKSYIRYGYIPLEDPVKEAYHGKEQTSRTLEYAYDDYCVARLAKALGHDEMAEKLLQRSKNYRKVFDPRTGYVNGRHEDGRFADGKRPDRGHSFITQGTPCQYSWYVPHDVYGMMECMGGREEYILKLDSMFSCNRMWHGNEPGHQISFMYNYAGQPWKTQREVRNIMKTEYRLGANGLSGNDDSGQMSAWYIFAAMGFYPVCPAAGYYNISGPTFPKMTIKMENGRKFTIVARGVSDTNIYIQSVTLNGKPYDKSYISHDDIAAGGRMEFVMGGTPNKEWAASAGCCPPGLTL